MKYSCQTIELTKLQVGHEGFIMPLCNKCHSIDCTNRIEYKNVSILGITRKMRVLVKGNSVYIVVDCKGFVAEGE